MKPTLVPIRPNGKLNATDIVRAELEQLRAQNGHILAMFMALLMERHNGGANIKIKNCEKYQAYGLNFRPLEAPLNDTLRVCVVDPKTNLPLTAGDSGGVSLTPETTAPETTAATAVTEHEPEPESTPETEAPPCGGSWHSDPSAMGRRCPECGSSSRGI